MQWDIFKIKLKAEKLSVDLQIEQIITIENKKKEEKKRRGGDEWY